MGNRIKVGVALAIPEPHAAVLGGWRRRIGDPEADKIPPHVTLLPPTEVEADQLDLIEKHLAEAAGAVLPFTMRLSGTGTFRPVSPVVFVQVVDGIAGCEGLERDVRSGPLAQELRFNYHPHVTVAHEVPDDALDRAYTELAHYEAQFSVTSFQVYEHGDDGVWRPRRELALTASR